ncbi:unnamed protein product [Nippostrongylus brasiliensis]|uniref:ZP domain-containing protein n=1 Tax=Nippostrongylus brasiliensis TaxID=27835 RepID=A0A0N4XW77_NIPBR|nr:unnamed protein product [Nippostrongylus brasiliensis]
MNSIISCSSNSLLTYGTFVLLLRLGGAITLPTLQLYNGHVTIDQPAPLGSVQHFVIGQPYTFEIQMSDVHQQDYIVEQCVMNGRPFIDNFGCVLCGDGILTSIETEQYGRIGAVKRTLVHFIAKQDFVNIACTIRVLNCCACAERSCERHPILAMIPGISHQLVYPIVIPATKHSHFPLWLLILLLILLLLCLLALCLIPFLLWRRRRKTVTSIVKPPAAAIGVETEKAELRDAAIGCRNVHQYSIDSGIHHVKPVVAVGERETTVREAEIIARDERVYSNVGNVPTYVFILCLNHSYTRRGMEFRSDEADRASYRNFAYERDMGRVAPLEGFDQLETCEHRRHGYDDDDYDVVERDVKRTHTSRFVQESRHREDDETSSIGERFREDDVQHAYYSHSLPV